MKRKVISSIRWTTVSITYRATLGFTQLIILARILEPSQLGLIGLSAPIIGLLIAFSDFGLSSSIMYFNDLTEKKLSGLYWMSLMSGTVVALLIFLCGPIIEHFYDAPGLGQIMTILSASAITVSAGLQFKALAEKSLRFKELAIIECCCFTLATSSTIILALSGMGAQAAAIGYLVGTSLTSISFWMFLMSGWTPTYSFSIIQIKKYIYFGLNATAANMITTVGSQADSIVIGKLFDIQIMSAYYPQREIAMRITAVINPIISKVSLPVIAMYHTEAEKAANIYHKTLLATASVNFPIYAWLAIFSDEFVAIVLGESFALTSEMMQILAILYMARSVGNPVGSLLIGSGHARLSLYSSTIVAVLATLTSILGGLFAGPIGILYGLTILYLLLIVPFWRFLVFPVTRSSFFEYHKQIFIPAFITALSALFGWFVSLFFSSNFSVAFSGALALSICYLSLSIFFNRAFSSLVLLFLKVVR